jgi:uncharacterized membrane protein (UPF0127 family)
MIVPWRLVNVADGTTVAEPLELADGFWSRFIGWQFRRRPAPGQGLLLVPCASIHTCWMRFAIDVVFLDQSGIVLAIRRGVRPWRVALAPRGTRAVLELPAGSAPPQVGDRLAARPLTMEAGEAPRSLRPYASN